MYDDLSTHTMENTIDRIYIYKMLRLFELDLCHLMSNIFYVCRRVFVIIFKE